jgi:ribonuclease P protein component
VLPKAERLTRSTEFSATVRRGVRAGTATLVVHLLLDPPVSTGHARAGLVAPRAVGGAVVRNRVQRRLRALVAPRLRGSVPTESWLVVRALPEAASATSARLAADLDQALVVAVRRATRPTAAASPAREVPA